MNKKQYKFYRLFIMIILIISISISINLNNYYLPIVFVVSASAAMFYCRKSLKSKELIADERDYKVAGDAARYSLYIYSWLGAILVFILMAISKGSGLYYDLSQYLAFSVCFLLLLNSFLFKYLIKKQK